MKKSFFTFVICAVLIGIVSPGCTDNQALREVRDQMKAEQKQKEDDAKFQSDMLRFQRLKQDAMNGDNEALREMKNFQLTK